MTNADWLACTDRAAMLQFLRARASHRKLLLFGAACCRRVWDLMTDAGCRNAVEAAERLADGLMTEEQFEEAMQPVMVVWGDLPDPRAGGWTPSHYMTGAARHLGTGNGAAYAASFAARGRAGVAGPDGSPGWVAAQQAEEAVQCDLLRDLFGDPSFPFTFDPEWLSGPGTAAVELARAICRDRRFDALPSLADMLQHAGCRDRAVLDHCRGTGPHVRGCWMLDALRGKEPAVCTGLLTEAHWQACADPEPMLAFLLDKGGRRKWRLFAVACCRRIAHLIADERSRRAVEIAARCEDGGATEEERAAAHVAARQAADEAWRVEWEAEVEANFCITPTYAAVTCGAQAASAALDAVLHDPRSPDHGWEAEKGWNTAAQPRNGGNGRL